MIHFQRIFRFFLTVSFQCLLVTVITFGFNSPASWAAMSIEPTITLSPLQLATISRKESMDTNKEGNTEAAQITATEEAKRFKAETIEGMNNSIVNPAYQPSGKTKQLKKQDNQNMKEIKAEARDIFDKS